MSMLSYNEALAKIARAPLGAPAAEPRKILEAVGAILAEDVLVPEDLPSADNSAMDGFAVSAAHTMMASKDKPIVFEVRGEWLAGSMPQIDSESAGVVYGIMTGAILPPSVFDAVIKIEDVEVFLQEGKKFVKIFAPVVAGNNIRPKGSDFRRGQKLFQSGQRLRNEEIMSLAGLGITEVLVFEKIRVAILSTGQEIVSHDQALSSPAQVRNSSSPFLSSYLSALDCAVDLYPLRKDSARAFYELFQSLIEKKYHLILTTGGVSMGSMDFVTGTLADLGVKIEFHKVAIRPGKPLLFGVHGPTGTAVFGLPGNPISTAIGARFFVTPLLKKIRNEKREKTMFIPARREMPKPLGLSCFFRACLVNAEGRTEVEILKKQGSYMLHSMVEADCWVLLSEDLAAVSKGQNLEVFSLNGV